jgi:hypothetical protein
MQGVAPHGWSRVACTREEQDLGPIICSINKDPTAAYTVTVSLDGACVRGLAHVFTYGIGSTSIGKSVTPVAGSSFTITLDPYSTTTIKLP